MRTTEHVQQLPAPLDMPRVETGALQFEGDWPGLFIRGDDAMGILTAVRELEGLLPHVELAKLMKLAPLVELGTLIEGKVIVKGQSGLPPQNEPAD